MEQFELIKHLSLMCYVNLPFLLLCHLRYQSCLCKIQYVSFNL